MYIFSPTSLAPLGKGASSSPARKVSLSPYLRIGAIDSFFFSLFFACIYLFCAGGFHQGIFILCRVTLRMVFHRFNWVTLRFNVRRDADLWVSTSRGRVPGLDDFNSDPQNLF
uniref:Transmembrane protein n=1 Tax=Manihot esculenta TaxID=3983 RepID=A0A2C9WHX6_MANES